MRKPLGASHEHDNDYDMMMTMLDGKQEAAATIDLPTRIH
jgi:hypothetical protein